MNDEQLDHILTQSLLTEDGAINEACMSELNAILENMPRTYERFANDKEWNTPIFCNVSNVIGYFVMWAVRQANNYSFPPNLEKITGYLNNCLRKEFIKREDSNLSRLGWGDFSLCEINKLLFDILWDLPLFQEWNTEECLGKNWLDLHALLCNVCLSMNYEQQRSLSQKI